MSTLPAVPNDVATRHVLVATATFMALTRGGFFVPVVKGSVIAVWMGGQTNIFHGEGPKHPRAALIEHETAKPSTAKEAGDVLSDTEVASGIAAVAAKQALVPFQIAAREAQHQAMVAADPPLTAAERKALRALIAKPQG